jgi:hypothetical protein
MFILIYCNQNKYKMQNNNNKEVDPTTAHSSFINQKMHQAKWGLYDNK